MLGNKCVYIGNKKLFLDFFSDYFLKRFIKIKIIFILSILIIIYYYKFLYNGRGRFKRGMKIRDVDWLNDDILVLR